jgi:hypothetical protein
VLLKDAAGNEYDGISPVESADLVGIQLSKLEDLSGCGGREEDHRHNVDVYL